MIADSLSEKRIDEIVDQRVDQRLKTRRSLVYCVADLGADVIALAIDSEETGVQRLKRESHQVIQTAVWIQRYSSLVSERLSYVHSIEHKSVCLSN